MDYLQKAQEIINRVHYMYMTIDGKIEFPNSYDGDVLKIAYKLAKEVLENEVDT